MPDAGFLILSKDNNAEGKGQEQESSGMILSTSGHRSTGIPAAVAICISSVMPGDVWGDTTQSSSEARTSMVLSTSVILRTFGFISSL